MKEFIYSLSNREISLLIWTAILVGWLLTMKAVRESILDVLRAFFVWKIMCIFITAIFYTFLLIILFQKVNIWSFELLKDTIIWILGTATIMVFRSVIDG